MKRILIILTLLHISIFINAQAIYPCSDKAYQVIAVAGTNGGNSVLYSYNIGSGSRTKMADLNAVLNAIGYNVLDNMLWGWNSTADKVCRLDAAGVITNYTVANLPTGGNYIAGDITPNGYLMLLDQAASIYYYVDVNSARTSTYLKLVNPLNSYVTATGGYTLSNTTQAADYAYNASRGKYMGVSSGAKIMELDATTNTLTIAATAVTNLPTGVNFGAVYSDSNPNNLYVFNNDNGQYYKINLSSNTATALGTSVPSNSNDGASCATFPIILPVSLTNFTVSNQNCNALLNWETTFEEKSALYQLEWSRNGKNFSEIASITSKNATSGANYTYVHPHISEGTYYFRLKMIDLDGGYRYSNTIHLNSRCADNKTITLQPNPTSNNIFISGLIGQHTILLLDSKGKQLKKVSTNNFEHTLNLEHLSRGMYIIQIMSSDKIISSQKVIRN